MSTRSLEELAPVTTTTEAPTTTIAPGRNFCDDAQYPKFDATASFPWIGTMPTPGEMPEGTALRTIQDQTKLKVGVDENTLFFSTRNPSSGEFEGFEPDLARLIAKAIFGDDDPGRVEFVPVVTGNKVAAVVDDKVDMTISVVSQTCDRWEQVDFTTTYYETTQRILVPPESPIHGVQDLEGRRVCVTSGSSSQNYLKKEVPDATIVPVEFRTDCLVALQEDRADAVLLPYSILAGLAAQDPTKTVLPDESLQTQSYGIAIKPAP